MRWHESLLDSFSEDVRTRLLARPYAEDERRIAETFHERLDRDDTVHVVGVNSGIYGLLAAETVGADRVRLFDDDPARLESAAALLADAGHDGVETASRAEYIDHAGAATVVVVDETRPATDIVDGLSPDSLRYLLVKSDDVCLSDRLDDAGFRTNRLRDFRPLGTPWERIAEAAPPGATTVPSGRRQWSSADAHGSANEHGSADEHGDHSRSGTAGFGDRVTDWFGHPRDGIDSPGTLLVTVAYALYRLPVAVLYAVLAAVPDPLLGIAGGLLLLGAVVVLFLTVVTSVGVGFRYWLEGTGASETTVTFSVLGAVALLILTSPLWLFALVGWVLSKLPDGQRA